MFTVQDVLKRHVDECKTARHTGRAIPCWPHGSLRGFDLSTIDLSEGCFPNIDFSGSIIRQAKNANFNGAIFDNVDAKGANFTGANLAHTEWRTAKIDKASFEKARLVSSYWHQTPFTDVRLKEAQLEKMVIDVGCNIWCVGPIGKKLGFLYGHFCDGTLAFTLSRYPAATHEGIIRTAEREIEEGRESKYVLDLVQVAISCLFKLADNK